METAYTDRGDSLTRLQCGMDDLPQPRNLAGLLQAWKEAYKAGLHRATCPDCPALIA